MNGLSKEEQKKLVSKEIRRLNNVFKEIDHNKKQLADGLIKRAAFMRTNLEIYENDLEEKGYVEMFSQSEKTDPYERERPVARLYNSLNKNYQSIMKQLTDLLPKDDQKKIASDGFDEFIYGRDD